MKKRLYFEPKAEIAVATSADDILQSSTESLEEMLRIEDGLVDRITW